MASPLLFSETATYIDEQGVVDKHACEMKPLQEAGLDRERVHRASATLLEARFRMTTVMLSYLNHNLTIFR